MNEELKTTDDDKATKLLESIEAHLRSIKNGVTFFVIITILAIIINILF